MARAIRIHETGGPEVLRLEEVEVKGPGLGEARLRQTAIGVNFIDVYHRTGLYPLALPSGIGVEAAGVVEAVGPGVTNVAPDDRVAYAGPLGSYCDARVVPAERLVKLPRDIPDRVAAASMLKGLTAHALVRRTHAVRSGETVLVHAAAGGVGLILVQWLKALGATVIGTVGSDDKARVAREHGCDHAVVYTREDFPKRVREITGGAGVGVVYDSVGKATFDGSLDCLAPFGLMVSFGNASGPVPPLDVGVLARKGSLFLTRPTVFSYIARRDDLERAAAALFRVIRSGKVRIEIGGSWPLAQAGEAQRALAERRTTGSLLLSP